GTVVLAARTIKEAPADWPPFQMPGPGPVSVPVSIPVPPAGLPPLKYPGTEPVSGPALNPVPPAGAPPFQRLESGPVLGPTPVPSSSSRCCATKPAVGPAEAHASMATVIATTVRGASTADATFVRVMLTVCPLSVDRLVLGTRATRAQRRA